jgi:hypothetical protein
MFSLPITVSVVSRISLIWTRQILARVLLLLLAIFTVVIVNCFLLVFKITVTIGDCKTLTNFLLIFNISVCMSADNYAKL